MPPFTSVAMLSLLPLLFIAQAATDHPPKLTSKSLVAPITSFTSPDLSVTEFVVTLLVGKRMKPVNFTLDTTAQLSAVPCKQHPRNLRLVHTVLTLNTTDGIPGSSASIRGVDVGCVAGQPPFNYQKAALAPGPAALPSQLAILGELEPKFAYCLSSRSSGQLFFGQGNYSFRASSSIVRPCLSYVPLKFAFYEGYLVTVRGISIDGAPMKLSEGVETIIGTVARYTWLPQQLYASLKVGFMKHAAKRGIKQVRSRWELFELCYNMTAIQVRRSPNINILFGGNVMWRVAASNYLVPMHPRAKNVVCFGFMNGRSAKSGAIIGTFMQEDTLVEFDIEKRMLGVSGSLVNRGTGCGHFNFG